MMVQTNLKITVKKRISEKVWVESCKAILNSKMPDKDTLDALLDYVAKFQIATETDLLNEFLNKTKTR